MYAHLGKWLEALRLHAIAPCRYSLRHGGVSHDLMSRGRSVEEAKRRGRWRSDTSLRRYAKESRVLSELRKVSPAVLEFGGAVQQQLHLLLRGSLRLAPPRLD